MMVSFNFSLQTFINNPFVHEKYMLYRHTIAAVVYKDDPVLERRMYLAVQKPQWNMDEWSVVQGGLEEHGGEEQRALYLELLEELGTDTFGAPREMSRYFTRLFGAKTRERYPERSGYMGKKMKYFYVEYTGSDGEISLGAELSSFRWMDKEEFLSSVKYADELKQVLDVMEVQPVSEQVRLERRLEPVLTV